MISRKKKIILAAFAIFVGLLLGSVLGEVLTRTFAPPWLKEQMKDTTSRGTRRDLARMSAGRLKPLTASSSGLFQIRILTFTITNTTTACTLMNWGIVSHLRIRKKQTVRPQFLFLAIHWRLGSVFLTTKRLLILWM
jgi:hypothetical protein